MAHLRGTTKDETCLYLHTYVGRRDWEREREREREREAEVHVKTARPVQGGPAGADKVSL